MKQIAQSYRTGKLTVVNLPRPRVGPGTVVVDTRASLISSGTERAAIEIARKTLIGKARERPDLVMRVIDKVRREGPLAALEAVRGKLENFAPLGYSLAGVVSDVGHGVTEFRKGQRVACAGAGYASHAEANIIPVNLAVAIPDEVSDDDSAFVTVGAIALHAVRLGEIGLGASVAVIGLGLIGQLAVQLAAAQGARVIAIDLDPARTSLAQAHGAIAAVRLGSDDPLAICASQTGGHGVDAVIIAAAAKTNAPLVLAGEVARDRAKIVIVGAMPIEVPRKEYYEKELSVVVSRSYGPGRYDPSYEERGRDYPIGYVRWTERRNLEAVLDGIASRRLAVSALVSHRFPFDRVLDAYDVVAGGGPHLGVLLTYPAPTETSDSVVTACVPTNVSGPIGIGVLGAGNFAQAVLLPKLGDLAGEGKLRLVAVASNRGLSAASAARRFHVDTVVGSLDDLLANPAVQAVIIATRHNLHADQVERALRAGRHVFVEKPLAIDMQQLHRISAAYSETSGVLMVGFNRRFAPYAREAKAVFGTRRTGLMMFARINAGPIPMTSWVQAADEGGGRIIGEVCHFVDLMSYWAGSPVVGTAANGIAPSPAGHAPQDNLTMTLTFADGSVGTILYTAMGDRSVPKEFYEMHCEGITIRIDDWRSLRISRGGRSKTVRSLAANKGHSAELAEFLAACRTGRRLQPIPWPELVATTEATIAAASGLSLGDSPGG